MFETLVAVTVSVIAGTLLIGILVNHNGILYKEQSLVNEGLSLNDTTREIDENLRQAVGISSGYPEAVPTYVTSSDTLVFRLPALSSTGILDNVYDFGVFTRDRENSKILKLEIFPDSQSVRTRENKILTTLLDSIDFTYFDRSGQTVSPAVAVVVKTSLSVLSETNAVGTNRSSSMTTTLRNTSL